MYILTLPEHFQKLKDISEDVANYIDSEAYIADFGPDDYTPKSLLVNCYDVIVGELEDMETDNINDDNFDYTNTKNYFSQMWYNIKHGNLIDATGDAIMGVGSVIGETVLAILQDDNKDHSLPYVAKKQTNIKQKK